MEDAFCRSKGYYRNALADENRPRTLTDPVVVRWWGLFEADEQASSGANDNSYQVNPR